MAEPSLRDALELAINTWFGEGAIDAQCTLDAMMAVIASGAINAGCNTDDEVAVFSDHVKNNLAAQLKFERILRGYGRPSGDWQIKLSPDTLGKVAAAAKRALDTGVPVRVEGEIGAEFTPG